MPRRRRKRGHPLRSLGLLALALVVIGIATPVLLWRGPGPAPAKTSVVIPEGSTIASAARALRAAHAIRSVTVFRRLVRLFGSPDPIKAGEFAIPRHASAARILDILQHGKALQHFFTVPEGLPSIAVQRRLMAEPLLTGTIPVPVEGSILPDTYGYHRGEARAELVRRMQDAMTRALATAWAARTPAAVVTSPRAAVILASIVEKETGIASERRMVAAVFSNRLKLGMPLQADPTVIYPITHGLPLGRRILESELHADNGYNTYVRRGLPEGPITNPGLASIKAVLDPAPSNAIYFVANGTGGHAFAATLAEHDANVKRWYAIRHARGEM